MEICLWKCFADDKLFDVKLMWKLDEATHLSLAGKPFVSLLLKPLEVDNEDFGCLVDIHLLGSQLVLFAFGAVPLIPFVKLLHSLELLEAVFKSEYLVFIWVGSVVRIGIACVLKWLVGVEGFQNFVVAVVNTHFKFARWQLGIVVFKP